jgi:hypothetical protein
VPDTEIVQVLGESEEIQMRWLRMIVALDLNFIATE